jgi:hypothetical protein
MKISISALERSRMKKAGMIPVAFVLPEPAPNVIPKGGHTMAMDDLIIEANAWAAEAVYNGAYFNGVTFVGYPALAEMAQRPEYRRISEVLATEMTRKWIKFQSATTGDKSKAARIAELETEMTRLDVQGAFRKMVELDGWFGRAHLYLDTGSTGNREELITSIGNGRDATTKAKFGGQDKRGFLRAVKPIEPVWCYPAKYNANDPLRDDWYNPQSWFCQGTEIHTTRLLTFVGRQVSDMLKPSYMFGGLSMTQQAKPYVDNWLRTRQAVADLIWSFSVRGLKTNLSTLLAGDGDAMFRRAGMFANMQNNQSLMLLDKDTEDFFNISTSLATLDALQGQAQEHMCSVTGTPVVKLLGIQPAGLNASSEGELTTWYDNVESNQEKFFTEKLTRVIDFVMLSLWGEVDEDITFKYESLRALTELELATMRKTQAETDMIYVEGQVLMPETVLKRLAADPNSPYDGLGESGLDPAEMEPNGSDPMNMGALAGPVSASTMLRTEGRAGGRDPAGDSTRNNRAPGDGTRPDRDGDRARTPATPADRARTPATRTRQREPA